MPYAIAPSNGHGCILPDYALIWIISLQFFCRQNGTMTLYRELKHRVMTILGYFAKQSEKDDLLHFDNRYLFLDWCND